MKRVWLGFVLLALVFGCTRVDPGHVGIKVNYWGADRGVSKDAIVTGMVIYNPISTTVFEYPTFTQTAVWTRDKLEGSPANEEITFNSREGLIFTADISLSISLNADKVPDFYTKFRSDNIGTFVHGYLRNVARDHANEVAARYTADELYGDKKEEFLKLVRQRINDELKPVGVSVEQFGFIGAPRAPESVVLAINSKIKAIQDAIRTENELRQATAEAKKTVATAEGAAKSRVAMAEGEAKANQVLAASITDKLLDWRRLQIQSDAVAKWNGVRPTVESGASGLLLNVTPGK